MKCRFVVTAFSDDYGYNCCEGVYDDPITALGAVLSGALDLGDTEFKVKFRHDDSNDDYYDIIITRPENEDHTELVDIYRVFYLRTSEKEEKENDNVPE